MTSNFFYRLLITCFSVLFLFSCKKDNDKDSTKDDDNPKDLKMVELVARVIQDSGLDFPESSKSGNRSGAKASGFEWPAEDYVTIDDSDRDNDGAMLVKIWLDSDNNIIPTPEWQSAHPNYCIDKGKYMRPAHRLLQFKIHSLPRDGVRVVQLNYIQIDGQKIKESVITDWKDFSPDWMYEAMSEVWNEMSDKVEIKDAIEPCDDRVRYTLHFSSKVTFDTPDAKTYEEFEFTIPLQFDEVKGTYTGIGNLVWLEGSVLNKVENDYIPFPRNKRGQFEIVSLTTPILAGGSIEDAVMNIKVPLINMENQSFLLISLAEFYPWVQNESGTSEYRIEDWQLMDDPGLIMAAYMNHQKQEEQGLLTEVTSIEIYQ
ncbi:MAG TPA: hypothetical protein VLZ75_07240 [Chitinophagales bacterium]|nr:hypothetical protein [Chitinophagales bacterium]